MPRVNESDVAAAADALLAQGRRPTIEAVRRQLGRGSPNNVNRLLDLWWAKLAARVSGSATADELPSALQATVRKIWAEMQAQAREASASSLVSDQQRLAKEEARLKSLAEQVAKEKELVDRLLPTLQEEVATLRKELRGAEIAAAKALQEKTAAEAAVVRAQADVSKATDRAAGNEKHWMEKMAALKTAADLAGRELRAAHLNHKKELHELRAQLSAAERREAQLASDNAALTERVAGMSELSKKEREELIRQRSLLVRIGAGAVQQTRQHRQKQPKPAKRGQQLPA